MQPTLYSTTEYRRPRRSLRGMEPSGSGASWTRRAQRLARERSRAKMRHRRARSRRRAPVLPVAPEDGDRSHGATEMPRDEPDAQKSTDRKSHGTASSSASTGADNLKPLLARLAWVKDWVRASPPDTKED